jgi:hypothetical protein
MTWGGVTVQNGVNTLNVKCPMCGVLAGEPCQYTTPDKKRKIEVGDIVRRAHYHRWFEFERKLRVDASKARTAAVAVPLESNRLEIINAERCAQVDEHAALHAWLREHGHILLRRSNG